ncbi:MAG: hypothetical protein CL862_07030 [Cyanobium sp. NAT70]|nr:hypothetical protein [Cyanobium sp. NAT70]
MCCLEPSCNALIGSSIESIQVNPTNFLLEGRNGSSSQRGLQQKRFGIESVPDLSAKCAALDLHDQ